MKLFNKKNLGKIITGVACFGVAFTVLYLVVNPRKVESNLKPSAPEIPVAEDTYFDKFANKLIDKFTKSEEPLKFKATLENLAVSSKEDPTNIYASTKGELALSIDENKNIEYTVDLDVSSGGSDLLLGFGYVNKYSYFSLGDKGFKLADTSFDEITNFAKEVFTSVLDLDIGGVSLDLSGLISGIDINSLLPQEVVDGDNVNFIINNDTVNLEISANKETLELKKINVKSLNIESISLSTLVSVEKIEKVCPFDDGSYKGRHISFAEAKVFSNVISGFNRLAAIGEMGMSLKASISKSGTKLVDIQNSVNSKLDDNHNPEIDLDIFATIEKSKAYAAINACYFDGCTYVTVPTENDSLKLKYADENFTSIYEFMIEIVSGLVGDELSDIFSRSSRVIRTISKATSGNLLSFDILSFINNTFEYFNFTDNKLIINLSDNANPAQIVITSKENENTMNVSFENFNIESLAFDLDLDIVDFDSTNIEKVKKETKQYDEFEFVLLRFLLRSLNTKTYRLTTSLSLSFPAVLINTQIVLKTELSIYIDYSSGYLKIFIETHDQIFWPFIMSYGVSNVKIGYDGETGLVHILNLVQELDLFTGFPFGDMYNLYYVTDLDNFIDNIAEYLLKDILYFIPDLVDEILGSRRTSPVLSRARVTSSYNIFESFLSFTHTYNEKTKEDVISTNFDLSAILGISIFKDLNLTLYGKREDDDSNFITRYTLSTKLFNVITLTAQAVNDNESSEQDEKCDALFSIYANLSSEEKALFDESYLNNPAVGWKIRL